jgi:hypothetical protein
MPSGNVTQIDMCFAHHDIAADRKGINATRVEERSVS